MSDQPSRRQQTSDPSSTADHDMPTVTDPTDDRDKQASIVTQAGASAHREGGSRSALGSAVGKIGRFLREIVIIVVVALVASALLRAFVVQAFFVPSGSMLPEINLNDRILVSRIGGIDRGEVVVFEDPGGWIPPGEQAPPPTGIAKALEWVGVLPASGREHLVKRVIGLPGDQVICCKHGKLTVNGTEVDESEFLEVGDKPADNQSWDVVVPADHIFVLGDNRYVSGDSSARLFTADPSNAFVPMDLVTGRAFAVIWPTSSAHVLGIPDAYDDVPEGGTPPDEGVIDTKPRRKN